jgi:ABC-type glycerol-3-phosphate transport system substrate-binding protein
VVAAMVAGCSGASSTPAAASGGPVAGSSAPAVESSSPAESAGAAAPVTLHMLGLGGGADDYWNALIQAFGTANPGITIEREVVPGNDFDAKWNAYIASRSGPDLVAIQAGAIWEAYKDALQPLPELAPELANFNGPENFCLEFDCTDPNHIYAIPYNMQGYVLYYNKLVLKEAGLDPDNPPTSWRDMAAACDKVKAIQKTCWALGIKDLGTLQIVWQLAQQTMTLDQQVGFWTGKTKWTDPEVVAILRLYQDMVQRGWFNKDAPSINHLGDAEGLFLSGKAAFIMDFVADLGTYRELGTKGIGDENLGAIVVPPIEDGFPLTDVKPGPLANIAGVAAATAWGVPVWSQNKAAALKWIEFAAQQDSQQKYLAFGEPARKGLDTSVISAPAFQQIQKIIAAGNGTLSVFYMGFQTVSVLQQTTSAIFLGQLTPEAAAEQIQAVQVGN